MDFAAMKRRELQALCKRHGLAAGGTNAALVARVTATLSVSGRAAEEAVGVVVGKGCMKRSPAGASGGDLDAAKRVTFELEEDDEAAEVGGTVTGRGRRRSQVLTSPAVAKTRGRQKAGDAPPAAKGMRRQTRSQAGGDSADESDSGGEAGADAPVSRSGRNAVNLGAGDGAERVAGAVIRKNSDKAEHEEVDAVGRKYQLKRKTRENDIEDADGSGQVGVSRRSTRSTGPLVEPDALSSHVEKKRGRRKAADVKEKTCVEEQPTEALQSGRTLRSGVVLVAPAPPIVSESKKSRGKVQEEEPAVEKVAKAEISGRTTRSSSVAPVPPIVSESKKSRGKVQEEEPAVEKVAKAEISGRTTRSSSVAPVPPIVSESKKSRGKVQEEEPSVEKVAKAEISGRTTSSVAPVPPIVSESKKSRGKVQEEEPAAEKVAKAEVSGRTTRSSSVAPVPPIVSESKKSRGKVQEEEPAVEKVVVKAEISGRTTRSSSVAPAVASPRVIAKKRGRKTDNVQSDGGPDEKMENKRQSSRLTTSGSIHHLASSGDEASLESLEQVAAPSKGLPLRRSRQNPSEANMMLNSSTTSESSNCSRDPTEFSGPKMPRPTMINAAKDGVEDGVEKPDRHLDSKKSKSRNVSATVTRNGGEIPFSESSGKASATDMQIKIPGPVRRSTRRSVVPTFLDHETNGMHEDMEKKQTVTKPVGRSTRRSVAPVILEKESKGLSEEIVPEAKRPTRKSVVPAMLEKGRKSIITEIIPEARVKRSMRKPDLPMVKSENNDHSVVVNSENLQCELEKQPTVKQPVRQLTRKSAVLAMPEKDKKGVTDMLNNENGDHTEMQIDKVGHLEKQLVVKEPVRGSTGKSVVPDVNENKGLHEELKSQVSVRTPGCKSVVSYVVNKDHDEFVRSEELSVKTRSAHTRLHVALQNDESLQRTTRKSSKLAISPSQSKPTASKGRPAKRRRTSSLQEDMPAEEQKENQIDYGAHTNDVIEVAISTDLEIEVLPFAAEKTNLQDSQLNSELEGILEIEMDGTTEKPPSHLPIPDCKDVGTLCEEAVRSIENDSGRFSPNFGPSPTGLQFLFSQGFTEKSSTYNAIPCPKNCIEESDVHKVKCQVETVVSSKSESYHSSDENSVRVEESGGCTFSSQQNNEQEAFSCPEDLVVSAQLDLSEDVDHVVRDVNTKDLVCKEDEKKDFIPSSDINVPHQLSHANEPAENVSGVSGAVICSSQSTPVSDEGNSDSSRLESPGALDNRIASSSTEVVQQDNKEEHNLHNGVSHGIHVSVMSEVAQVEVSKSEKMLLPDVETSGLRDAQLNSKRVGNEFEEHIFNCGKDGSGKNNISQLVKEYVMASCQDQELKLPHDLSAVKSPKGSTTCQDEFVIGSGTLENTEQGSATLESNQQYRLSEEAEPHSLKKICSSSVEQLQFVLDDVYGQDGTQEKAAPGSVTPECKQKCGLPDEADQHPLNNERCSTTDEQSPLGLQLLFSQERIEEPSEHVALAVQAKNGVDESKDILVGCGVEKTPVPESVSDQGVDESKDIHAKNGVEQSKDIHVGYSVDFSAVSKSEDCAYTCDQGNEYEGLTMSCHEEEQMTCQLDLLEAANCMKEQVFTNPDEVSYDENNKPVHSTDISSSYEKIDANGPVKHASGLGDGLLSSSLIASADDTDVHPNSNPHQFESTDFLDELKGCSSTDALQQGLKEQCDEPKENQVTSGVCPSDVIGGDTAKDLESEVPPLPAEKTSNMLELFLGESSKGSDMYGDLVLPSAENEDDSNTCLVELQVEEMVSSEPDYSKGLDMHGDLVLPRAENEDDADTCHVELQAEKIVSSEPESSKGSDMHGDPVLPSAENEDNSITCHVELQVQKTVSSEPDSHQGSREDLTIVDGIRGFMFSSQLEHEKEEQQIAPLVAAELLDEQANSELETGEYENCNFSSEGTSEKIGTVYVENNFHQLHEDSHIDHIQGQELPDDLPAPKSPVQSIIGQDSETLASPDEQPNPELDSSEFEERNLSREDTSGIFDVKTNLCQFHEDAHMDYIQRKGLPNDLPAPKSAVQSTIGQDAETSASPDEQPNPELDSSESEERNLSREDTSGISDVKTNLCQFHEDAHMDSIQGKGLPNDLPAPKSPVQSITGQHAETLASPDEQPNPELHSSEFEERNLSREDTSGISDLKTNLCQFHEDTHMDSIQGKGLPNDLPAPKSPVQSTIGQDVETLASPDEQPNPELDSSEFEEPNLSREDTSGIFDVKTNLCQFHEDAHMDSIQGKGLPNDLRAPKSPVQSSIGQDAETLASPDEQPNPELHLSELSREDTSDIFDVKTNIFQSHEDTHMDPIKGKGLPNDLSAPKSPEQSTIGQDAETSAWSDEQLNPKLEAVNFGELNFSSEDTSGLFGTGYGEDTLFPVHEYSPMDPNHGKESADKSLKQSTICQDENELGSETSQLPDEKLEVEEFEKHNHSCDKAASWDDKEEYSQHNDDQASAATLIEGSTSGMALLSATGTPALTYEQLNSKLEGNKEHNHYFDADNSYISGNGLMDNNIIASLPKDFCIDTCFEDELPIGTPAAKSSGESFVFRDNSVPGSVETCQTSGRRRIEEISTKLLSFKISSAVKGSYIAMESAKTKQGDNPRPISLLRDMENVPAANPDHPAELNTDLLDVKDSPRQGTPDGL